MELLTSQRTAGPELVVDLTREDFSCRDVVRPAESLKSLQDEVLRNSQRFGDDWLVLSHIARSIDSGYQWNFGASLSVAEQRTGLLKFSIAGADYAVRQTQRVLKDRGAELELSANGSKLLVGLEESARLILRCSESLGEGLRRSVSTGADSPFESFQISFKALEQHQSYILHLAEKAA